MLFFFSFFWIAGEPPAGIREQSVNKKTKPKRASSRLLGRANGAETGLSQKKVSHISEFSMCLGFQLPVLRELDCPTLRGPNPEEYRSIPPLRRSYGWKLVMNR
jgi:hypothetical protein